MAPKKDPLKAKQAKQKKLAIGGGVLLLALLAFQVPRTMKMLNPPGNVTTSASTAPAATTPGATPLAPPSLDGSSAATASAGTSGSSTGSATSSDGVVDASSGMPANSGQLVSFNSFKAKDPFRQQIQDCPSGACSGATTPAATGGSAGAAPSTGSGSTTAAKGASSSGGGTGSGSGKGSASLAPQTTASIAVNGVVSKVSVGHTFPASKPVFVLASLTAKEAKISISGGSLDSGAPTVTLGLGKTLKLQNTADGTIYTLKLVGTA